MYVLRSEERLEHPFLTFGERREVDAPVRMVLDALLARDESWRKVVHGLDRPGKVVAVHA